MNIRNFVLGSPKSPLDPKVFQRLSLVAAQAGYVSGLRAMGSMAVDSWVPRWFRHLSDRPTISNGILLIGVGAIVAIVMTGGSNKGSPPQGTEYFRHPIKTDLW